MADFLTRAACNGVWPKSLSPSTLRSRPELVSKLMRERNVARFIVAPDGFGKSTLAAEYADVVFSFQHVFWIDCHSPCFLRDLDNESLGRAINRKDAQANLVVFDRVPPLDEARTRAFSHLADRLLSQSCEVIATMPPASDAFSGLHRDRVCLFARDLLLSDEELREEQRRAKETGEEGPFGNAEGRNGEDCARSRDAGRPNRFPDSGIPLREAAPDIADDVPSALRIPSIAWGRDGGRALLRGLADDDLPEEQRAWFFGVLALQGGNLSEKSLIAPLGDDVLDTIAEHYPLVTVERDSGDFRAIRLSPEILVRGFSPQLPSLAALLGIRDTEELTVAVGNHALRQGRLSYACRFVQAAGLRATRERWLADNGLRLLVGGAVAQSCRLFASMQPRRSSSYLDACALQAWRLLLLGKQSEAHELGKRVILSPYSTEEAQICAALLISSLDDPGDYERADSALRSLMGISQDSPLPAEEMRNLAQRALHAHDPFLRSLACMRLSLRCGAAPAQETWEQLRVLKAPGDALIVGACWLVREYGATTCSAPLTYLEEAVAVRFSSAAGRYAEGDLENRAAAWRGDALGDGAEAEQRHPEGFGNGFEAFHEAHADLREPGGFDLVALFAARTVEQTLKANGLPDLRARFGDEAADRIACAHAELDRQKEALYGTVREHAARRNTRDRAGSDSATAQRAAAPADARRPLPHTRAASCTDTGAGGANAGAGAGDAGTDGAYVQERGSTALAPAPSFAGDSRNAGLPTASRQLFAIPPESRDVGTPQNDIPLLYVKLFGGMDVSLAGHTFTDAEFRRSKSKTLLALLVLAEGRVITRERLARMLWDSETTPEHCLKRNLYSVWSQLRRTLTLPDGNCPYVMKQQGGYRVDMRYVVSDVTRANELCRNAALRRSGSQDAQSLLNGYYEIFAGGLLPDEAHNPTIIQMRKDYRKRIVNALLTASSAFAREGHAEDALCYAICAFDTDKSREDVYLTLMAAQHAAGQRDQAIETYFACRRYLSTELGIDPSPPTERLYMQILTNE